MMTSSLEKGIERLSQGRPIILSDDERETEGDIAFAACHCTPQLVNLCLNYGRGLLCVALWPEDAARIGVQRLSSNNRDHFGTPFGMPIGLIDGSSGISAIARADTIRAVADKSCDASRFAFPGHVHTLLGHPAGLAGRVGHTEGILDLLRHTGIAGPGVLCEILNGDGEIANSDELQQLCRDRDMPIVRLVEVQEIIRSK
jgi:3,4-dihydroxy-2-butanone 4-phosphate synthase